MFIRWLVVVAICCTSAFSFGRIVDFKPEIATIQLPAKIDIPGNLENGSVLWRSDAVAMQVSSSSPGDIADIKASAPSLSTDGRSGIYSTNTSGIGIRYSVVLRARNFPEGVLSEFGKRYVTGWIAGDSYAQSVTVELIKIGSISDKKFNRLNSGIEVSGCIKNSYCWQTGKINLIGDLMLNRGPSCKVATPLIAVPLGKVSTSAFSVIGETSSPRSFSITLSCSGGAEGISVFPFVTLTDVVHPENATDILSLSTQSTASGVGIQVLHDQDILKFGPDSSSPQNINRWSAGEIKQGMGVYQIPLRARYVRTAAPLRPGKADGQITFTMSWR